ncbi:alpha/beta hydrolase [Nocardia sp. NPDC056000]|uniref:alpha/beta hydrolase n=1 Tax=Nocardia sp. NPDC056000 TaxID=3345674 RepID=UPI0035D5A01E
MTTSRYANHRGLSRSAALLLSVIVAVAAIVRVPGSAAADTESAPLSPNGSHLDRIETRGHDAIDMYVHSAAMNTDIRLQVLRAVDPTRPAPTLYLLNGSDGGVGGGWYDETDVVRFFADKQVNVVIPIGGAGSYFTDWRSEDPTLGRPRWTTFLTRELPPIVDATLNGSGVNAIAGISMGGTAVFQLAEAAPGLYRAIASYSGCVPTSDPAGQAFVALVVARFAGSPTNMWGPPDDPEWTAKDPALHVDLLRGTEIYVSVGSGLPGPLDTPTGVRGDTQRLTWQLLFGSPLEVLANDCTHRLRDRLHDLAIPATFDFRPTGTHSWGYWQQDLHNSWPRLEAALSGPNRAGR